MNSSPCVLIELVDLTRQISSERLKWWKPSILLLLLEVGAVLGGGVGGENPLNVSLKVILHIGAFSLQPLWTSPTRTQVKAGLHDFFMKLQLCVKRRASSTQESFRNLLQCSLPSNSFKTDALRYPAVWAPDGSAIPSEQPPPVIVPGSEA